MTPRSRFWTTCALLLGVLIVGPVLAQVPDVPRFDRTAPSGDPPPVPGAEGGVGPEVLGRGPVHEGFAQPVTPTPRQGPVISRQPPEPIQEVPPEQRPEGDNVQWVPGYWGWDEDRSDYIWISGFWRVVPPGRKWMPGYWARVAGGWSWVNGFWADASQPAVPYAEMPPESLDRGPNFPPIDDSYSWVPGNWISRDDRWLWRPGYWCAPRPGWIYCPPRWCWTPRGYLFVNGFWDRCWQTRGLLFAPVWFPPALYGRAGFRYTPGYTVGIGGALGSLWVRPGAGYYAFGDFYGPRYATRGFQPWHLYGPRYRDPSWGYYLNSAARTNPGWARNLASTYDGRVRGTIPPPARTLTAQERRTGPRTLQPLAGLRDPGMRLTRVPVAERRNTERTVSAFRSAGAERAREELRSLSPGTRPTPLNLSRVPAPPVVRAKPEESSPRSATTRPIEPRLRGLPTTPATRSTPPPRIVTPRTVETWPKVPLRSGRIEEPSRPAPVEIKPRSTTPPVMRPSTPPPGPSTTPAWRTQPRLKSEAPTRPAPVEIKPRSAPTIVTPRSTPPAPVIRSAPPPPPPAPRYTPPPARRYSAPPPSGRTMNPSSSRIGPRGR
jgi:hypothetical protein